ncbi:MAG: amidohydrolase family protein [Gemmatimonadaceae bacterium]
MTHTRRILRMVLLAIAAHTAAAQSSSDTLAHIAFTNATVIDGTGAPPLAGQTILVKRGVIEAVFETGSRALPHGVRAVDLSGKFVIPGLIDAHVHNATDPKGQDAHAAERLGRALLGGLTSVRDMAGDAIALKALAKTARRADALLPRIYYASLMAGPSFFKDPRTGASAHGGTPGEVAWMKGITPATDLKIAVRDAKATGATAIKIYADLPADLVTKITAEAHRQGMKVWAHSTVFPATATDDVDAGVDVISHALYLYWAAIPNPPLHYSDRVPPRSAYDSVAPDGPAMEALYAKMKAQHTVFDVTLSILPRFGAAKGPSFGLVDPPRAAQWAYDATRAAHAAGVTICAGTDGMMPPPSRDSLPALHGEMELLVSRAGFTPLEAITAATLNSAMALGAASKLGTVAAGKLADLVVLNANPADDIRNTRAIAFVVRGGVIHRRDAPGKPSR